jgi:hypothetical protein
MEGLGRRPSVLLLTVVALAAMLAVGALLVFQARPVPNLPKLAPIAKVDKLQQILRQIPDQAQLEQAQTLAAQGTSANLLQAILQLDRLNKTSAVSADAQLLMHRWSQQLIALTLVETQAGSPSSLRSAIALLGQLPKTSEDFGAAQGQIRKWQNQLDTATRPQPSTPSVDSVSVDTTQPIATSQEPTTVPRDLTINLEQAVEGIVLQVTGAHVEASGDFQIFLTLTNNSSQRYTFLPTGIHLEDGEENDPLEPGQEKGNILPGSSLRLVLSGHAPWKPPYRLRLEENRSSGQRDFNLLLPL